jgi:heme exporter protein D
MKSSSWPWFCAWFAVGALGSLALLAILTIGVYLLPLALLAAGLLATRRGSSAGLPGLVSGLGVPLLYVAFLNRGGPGNVCTTTSTSQSCVDEYNPWMWLAAGMIFLLAGIVLGAVRQRRATLR